VISLNWVLVRTGKNNTRATVHPSDIYQKLGQISTDWELQLTRSLKILADELR